MNSGLYAVPGLGHRWARGRSVGSADDEGRSVTGLRARSTGAGSHAGEGRRLATIWAHYFWDLVVDNCGGSRLGGRTTTCTARGAEGLRDGGFDKVDVTPFDAGPHCLARSRNDQRVVAYRRCLDLREPRSPYGVGKLIPRVSSSPPHFSASSLGLFASPADVVHKCSTHCGELGQGVEESEMRTPDPLPGKDGLPPVTPA